MEYGGSRFSLDPDRVTTDRASEHVPECIRWHPRLNGTFSGTKRLRDNLRDNGGARRGDRGCFPVTFWKNKFHAKFFEFPRVGRAALLATGQSFSGYIRHSASRAASLYRKRGSPQHCFPPLRGAICSSQLEGQSSDYPGRAFTAVRTIPTPNAFGAICAKTQMKVDIPRIQKVCILTRNRYICYY